MAAVHPPAPLPQAGTGHHEANGRVVTEESLDGSTYNGEPTNQGGGPIADSMIDESAPPTPTRMQKGGEDPIPVERLGERSHNLNQSLRPDSSCPHDPAPTYSTLGLSLDDPAVAAAAAAAEEEEDEDAILDFTEDHREEKRKAMRKKDSILIAKSR